jgi:hypothetical protein
MADAEERWKTGIRIQAHDSKVEKGCRHDSKGSLSCLSHFEKALLNGWPFISDCLFHLNRTKLRQYSSGIKR